MAWMDAVIAAWSGSVSVRQCTVSRMISGGSALSDFRAAALLRRLQAVAPQVTGVSARHVHWVATETEPDQAAITASIHAMIKEVQKYVPGYRLVNGPVFDGNRVSVYLEVEGLGDYLPKYAGNLDIMTAAAARTAEMFAEEILEGRLAPEPVAA